MTQDPFKLHPLPPVPPGEWADRDDDDLDDEGTPPLPVAEEVAAAHELVFRYLAGVELGQGIMPSSFLRGMAEAEGRSERVAALLGKLRHHRPDLVATIEVTDGGSDPPSRQVLELTQLPLLIGHTNGPAQLGFSDPEVPALRGFIYQIDRHAVYQDIGAPGGTLLERLVKGKLQLFNLKGEPVPLAPGDRLVLGGVATSLVFKGARPEGGESAQTVLQGIALSREDAPAIAPPKPPPPPPPPPAPVPVKDEPLKPPPPLPPSKLPLVAAAVMSGLVGLFVGQVMAPKPPPMVATDTPVPVSIKLPTVQASGSRLGPSLELKPDGQLRLVEPPLKPGTHFFLLTGADKENPDPHARGVPFALGRVTGDSGEAELVFAPSGLSAASLASAPALEAASNDQRLLLFTALYTLQSGQKEEAEKLFTQLATGEDAPVAALKGLAYLQLQRSDLINALKHLRAALAKNGSDPEVHFLLGRLHRQRFLAMTPTDPRRAAAQDDARSAYEEAFRQWLLPPASVYAWSGHELGLKGEELLEDYLLLLSRITPGAVEPIPPGAGSSPPGLSPSGPGAGTGLGPSLETGDKPAVSDPGAQANAARPSEHSMVRIAGGAFSMGGDDTDPADEKGLKGPVVLRTFYMDKFEVSNAQLERVIPDHKDRRGSSQGDKDPAVNVTWEEAQTYCRSVGLRLPSEAEWEKAARGTDGRTFPWGEQEARATLMNYKGAGTGKPAPVDSHPEGASVYGALNMAGNVWEWTSDWYDPTWYQKLNPGAYSGPASGQRKVIRGGSFADDASDARTSNRASAAPGSGAPKIGFRCARDG